MWRNIFLLFPISAFAQLGMKIPAEYDGGEYINPETWWFTIFTIVIIFIGPYLITRKIDDFDSSVYFRWFFVFFAGLLISIIIIPLMANKNDFSFWIITIQVGIAFYGLITQKPPASQ